MKLKHEELEPEKGKAFEKCKLGREPYGKALKSIVETYSDGFVMAVNNEWGTGKTTFIKMWKQYLEDNGFENRTIYFNAWENDFQNNALVPILAELKKLSGVGNKANIDKVVEKASILFKNFLSVLMKSLLKKNLGEEFQELITEGTLNSSDNILNRELEEYTLKKEAIVSFRDELQEFVKGDKPLIFIVDELDRCRPDYAVEVLEQIKHFFAVRGIIFVLSIDKEHLSSSIKGFYGSENINTEEYLRRFIDLEYSIPEPPTEKFIVYLCDYYGFKNLNYPENDYKAFVSVVIATFHKKSPTLRQQEKIFALTKVVCNAIKEESVFLSLVFFLTYSKIMEKELFENIQNYKINIQDLAQAYENLIDFSISDTSRSKFLNYQAWLLWFYNNRKGESKIMENLVEYEIDFKREFQYPITQINSSLGSKEELSSTFSKLEASQYSNYSLSTLIEKINLTVTTPQ